MNQLTISISLILKKINEELMKKTFLILLIVPLLSFSQKNIGIEDKFKITESIEAFSTGILFSKRVEISTTPTGTNVEKAEKGYKFLEMMIRMKNITKITQSLDLAKFQLVDEKSTVYTPNLCQANNLNKIYCDKFDFKLKKNKKKFILITFSPLIPDDISIKTIRYDGVDIYEFKE
ncbi:MAG: hypothetical protein CMC05_13305 [Flavobacteriaceae bacterium]|nr:hypothetical protein [Flavobacteriaceae bacterium]